MSIRFDKGKARPKEPRLKDLPNELTGGEPDRKRGADGRFAPGNKAATERGVKAIIKRHLGAGADLEKVEGLYRETLTMYRSFARELPMGSATVAEMLAREARSSVLSAHYATLAESAGTGTKDSKAYAELSLKFCARAERLAVTAWDLSQRLLKAQQTRKKRTGFDVIDAEAARLGGQDDSEDLGLEDDETEETLEEGDAEATS